MRVLADFHHQDLYYSLQLLFEKRLGWELYRPIGLEWYHEKYWDVFPHIGTAQQYLALDQATNTPVGIDGACFPDKELVNKQYDIVDGIYYVKDPSKGVIQRAITLDRFKNTEFDILVSSIPQHIGPFNKLISLYQPKAKHIFQVGNAWGHLPGVKNILSSTAPFWVPNDINAVFYHQEFDLNIFHYEPPTNQTKIFSFIHLMREMELFNQYKADLSPEGWEFCTHGAGMDKDIAITTQLADRQREAAYIWHVKPEGDGYGHTLHNAYAIGRPTIIKANYYQGKAGEALLEDLVTCLDISRRTVHENEKILRILRDNPEKHLKFCENARDRFRQVVSFDEEELRIRMFLADLR